MTNKLIYLFTVIVLCSFAITTKASKLCDPANDYEILKDFYITTNGNNWTSNFAWPDFINTTPVPNLPSMEDWTGITLNASGCVSILKMPLNNVTGNVPGNLSELTDLTYLNLSNNPLTGSIPTGFQYLSNLRYLGISSANLSGSIPTKLAKLSNLEELYLQENNLTGNIPTELGDLINLEGLSLFSNNLTGSIPTELGDLSNLIFLLVNDNQLSGCYDPALDKLCMQLGAQNKNEFISDDNYFTQPWQVFCDTGNGACPLGNNCPPADFNIVNTQQTEEHAPNFCQAEGSTGNGFTLLQNTNGADAAAIWANQTIDLSVPFTADFSIRFTEEMINETNADGITFTLQKAPGTISSIGLNGGYLGYGGISPSVSVEFDVFENPTGPGLQVLGDDLLPGDNDHSTINYNGTFTTAPGSTVADLGEIEDGNWHDVQISWDACQQMLCVEFDGVEIYCENKDLVQDVFAGDPSNVVWGFTAGKWSHSSQHDVCFCSMDIGDPCDPCCYDIEDAWLLGGNTIGSKSNVIGTLDNYSMDFVTNGELEMSLTTLGDLSLGDDNVLNGSRNAAIGVRNTTSTTSSGNLLYGWENSVMNASASIIGGQGNSVAHPNGTYIAKNVALGWNNRVKNSNQYLIGAANTATQEYSGVFGVDLDVTKKGAWYLGGNASTNLSNNVTNSLAIGWGKRHTALFDANGLSLGTSALSNSNATSNNDKATARLDVYAPAFNGFNSGVRFRDLPESGGNVLVKDADGYIYDSKIAMSSSTIMYSEEDQKRIAVLEEEIVALKILVKELTQKVPKTELGNRLNIYPNPNKGNLYAEYLIKETTNNAKLVITNAEGIEVSTTKINCTGNCKSNLKLPNNLSAGMYYCTLYINDTLIESTPFVYQQ